MSHHRLVLGALCSLLCITSCNETPEFRVELQGIGSGEDTLYVNVSLTSPAKGAGGVNELSFDVRNHQGGTFTFGLTLDFGDVADSEHRRGTLDLMLASGGCIHRIFSAPITNDTGRKTALQVLTLNLQTPAESESELRPIPIVTPKPGTTDTCYPIKRPTITAIEREITGAYGATNSKLVVYGWGLLRGTTATGQLPTTVPVSCPPNAAMCQSAWNPVSMGLATSDSASTVRLPLDTTALSKQVGPLLDIFGRGLTGDLTTSLQFLSREQTQKMAAGMFPFKVTVTTPVGSANQTDSYTEDWSK
ncbi:MAG: hypothetical protein JNM40_23070 [Myxococcales bacterium]|nr:hypothetical protein [Myxococcales bacterium]